MHNAQAVGRGSFGAGLHAECSAWSEAWCERAHNPLLQRALLAQARTAERRSMLWSKGEWVGFALCVLISCSATALLVAGYLRFTALASSAIASSAFAARCLSWEVLLALGLAIAASAVWVLVRFGTALAAAGSWLDMGGGRDQDTSLQLAATMLADHDFVVGLVVYAGRMLWRPLLLLSLLGATLQLLLAYWRPGSAEEAVQWGLAGLPGLALAALLTALVQFAGGLATALGLVLMVCGLTGLVRHPAVLFCIYLVIFVIQLFALQLSGPGRLPTAKQDYDLLYQVFSSAKPVLILCGTLLGLLAAVFVHTVPRVRRWLVRTDLAGWHLPVALAVLALLFGQAAADVPDEYAIAVVVWPLQASSIWSNPNVIGLATWAEHGSLALLFRELAWRSALMLGLAVVLGVLYLLHARLAVHLRRRAGA